MNKLEVGDYFILPSRLAGEERVKAAFKVCRLPASEEGLLVAEILQGDIDVYTSYVLNTKGPFRYISLSRVIEDGVVIPNNLAEALYG